MKKTLKTAITIFGVGLLENILLMIFYSIPITQQTIIATLVFTALLTLILKQMGVVEE